MQDFQLNSNYRILIFENQVYVYIGSVCGLFLVLLVMFVCLFAFCLGQLFLPISWNVRSEGCR